MPYGHNPNKTRKSYLSEPGEYRPMYPEVFLKMGNCAIWWTGTITGYIWGDDCITWIAPIAPNSVNSHNPSGVVDYLSARPIQTVESWDGTFWADRPEGPNNNELVQIEEQVRDFTLLASKFRGKLH